MTAPTPREVHVHDGEWCVACLAQGGRDALEFATRREPLDRTVVALYFLGPYGREQGWTTMQDSAWIAALAQADAFIAEYARLEAER